MVGCHLSPHTTKLASVLHYLGRVDKSYLLANVELGVLSVVHIIHLDEASVVVCITTTSPVAQDRSLHIQTRRLRRETDEKANSEGEAIGAGFDKLARRFGY